MGTKAPMTAFLPATPCSEEMRAELVKLAKRERKSLAELQRTAISLFLAKSARSATKSVSHPDQGGDTSIQERAS